MPISPYSTIQSLGAAAGQRVSAQRACRLDPASTRAPSANPKAGRAPCSTWSVHGAVLRCGGRGGASGVRTPAGAWSPSAGIASAQRTLTRPSLRIASSRGEQRVAQPLVVAGQRVVGRQAGEHGGDRVHRDQRTVRVVAAGEGQVEAQLVEPVGPAQVAEPVAVPAGSERRLDGERQPGDERVDVSLEDAARSGVSARAARARSSRSGASKSVRSSTSWTSVPTRAPPGTSPRGSVVARPTSTGATASALTTGSSALAVSPASTESTESTATSGPASCAARVRPL